MRLLYFAEGLPFGAARLGAHGGGRDHKLGESLADGMFKLFVLDAGFKAAHVALYFGGYGMAASVLGSLGGGVLAARRPLFEALALTSILRCGPLVAQPRDQRLAPPWS